MYVISYNEQIGEAIAIHRGYFFSIMKNDCAILYMDNFCGVCVCSLTPIADFPDLESAMDKSIELSKKEDPWDNAWDSYCPITVANRKELGIAIKDL